MYLKKFTSTIFLFLLVASTWAGTLTDDFSDRNMDEWTKTIGSNWKIVNGELVLGPGDTGFTIGKTTWKDYTISISLKIIEHEPVDNWMQGAGLGIRVVDAYNSYRFTIGTCGQSPKQVQTYFAKDGMVNHLESKPLKWELNTWYDLKSTVEGNLLKHYVNGELVLEYTDNTYPAGKVGIGLNYAVTAHFDNFVITGDDIPDLNLSVSPKAKIAATWGRIKK